MKNQKIMTMRPGNQMNKYFLSDSFIGFISFISIIFLISILIFGNSLDLSKKTSALSLDIEFGRIDGLFKQSEVRLSGIKIGFVESIELLDSKNVLVSIILPKYIPIPKDTAAVVETDGLFGDKYIELYPGGEDIVLLSGDKIIYSQDSIVLDDIILQVSKEIKS